MDSGAVSQTDVLISWFLCHRVPETLEPGVGKGEVSQETLVPVPGPFVNLEKSFPLFVPVSLSVQ